MSQSFREKGISAEKLAVGYPTKGNPKTILKGLDLRVHPGELVCLLGPNGAGKSTLIRTLSGMQVPLKGSIKIDGEDFSEIRPRDRAKLISIVSSDTPPDGIMDVYAFTALGRHPYSGWFGGLNDGDHKVVDQALRHAGASALKNRQVSELSDGERQKAAIARALAQESRIMLLDEPTAFLDLPGRIELIHMLRDLAHRQQIGMLLSTHDLDLALRFADKLWLITPEHAVVEGYPEVLAFNGEIAHVFSNKHVDWDTDTGAFKPRQTPKHLCHIQGNGPVFTWTKRCLERHGFGISNDPQNSMFCIEIKNTEPGILLRILQNSKPAQEFDNLEGFCAWLQTDWPSVT